MILATGCMYWFDQDHRLPSGIKSPWLIPNQNRLTKIFWKTYQISSEGPIRHEKLFEI